MRLRITFKSCEFLQLLSKIRRTLKNSNENQRQNIVCNFSERSTHFLNSFLSFLRAPAFSKGGKGEANGTLRRGRSSRDGGSGRTPGTVNFTEREEQRGISVTRGEKRERRKETRCLLYAAICCAINPRNTDTGQELSGIFF